MPNYTSLEHIFLIAMPQLKDPFFRQSVVYLWEYNEYGAKGIIVNKPLKTQLGDLLRYLEIPIKDKRAETHPIAWGGPVDPKKGFLVQRTRGIDFETGKAELDITICYTRDDLLPLAEGTGLSDTLAVIGYSQWEAGQLDKELKNNDWLVAPFNESTLFSMLEDQTVSETNMVSGWREAVATMGINLNNLSLEAGHA
jgi:putative transcriptional regulator